MLLVQVERDACITPSCTNYDVLSLALLPSALVIDDSLQGWVGGYSNPTQSSPLRLAPFSSIVTRGYYIRTSPLERQPDTQVGTWNIDCSRGLSCHKPSTHRQERSASTEAYDL